MGVLRGIFNCSPDCFFELLRGALTDGDGWFFCDFLVNFGVFVRRFLKFVESK